MSNKKDVLRGSREEKELLVFQSIDLFADIEKDAKQGDVLRDNRKSDEQGVEEQ